MAHSPTFHVLAETVTFGVLRVVGFWPLVATGSAALPSLPVGASGVSPTRYARGRWPNVVTYGATDTQGGEMRPACLRLLYDSGYHVLHPGRCIVLPGWKVSSAFTRHGGQQTLMAW